MSKTVIVIDSTADLPESLRRELDLHMVPLNVHFGTEVYKDQVDLDSKTFYQKLKASKDVMPRTSQPSLLSLLICTNRWHLQMIGFSAYTFPAKPAVLSSRH